MIHYMNLNNRPFQLIKNGSKSVEMRLYDEKRAKIKVGDQISFTNLVDGFVIDEKKVAFKEAFSRPSFISSKSAKASSSWLKALTIF